MTRPTLVVEYKGAMAMEDLQKRMDELLAVHKELEHHMVRMLDRQGDIEERQIDIEALVKQVAENNIRVSRILEIHDYDIDELDARLRRLEERRPRGRA